MADIDAPLLTVSQTFPGGTLTRLPAGNGFKRIVWQQDPYRAIWALRSDGVLVSLTYRNDQNVYALARHVFDGEVKDVAVIPHPDGTQDQLWLLIDRTANGSTTRRVERMAKEHIPVSASDLSGFMLMDAAVIYSGASTPTLTGLSHLEGKTVHAVTEGRHLGSYTVASGQITLNENVTSAVVGLTYTSAIESVPLAPDQTLGRPGVKSVPTLWLNVLDAIGGEVATNRGDWVIIDGRESSAPIQAETPALTGVVAVKLLSGWDRDITVQVRQTLPLPLTILDFTTTTRTSA